MRNSNRKKRFIKPWIDGFLAFFCVVVINMYFIDSPVSIDLTDDQRYSLAPESKQIVQDIHNNMQVTYYTSHDLPEKAEIIAQSVDDLFREIVASNPEHITFEKKYPLENENDKKEADLFGISDIKYNVLNGNDYEVKSGYSGIRILYKDKHESIPVVGSEDTLEYQVIAPIYKLSLNEEYTVGFTVGHDEYDSTALKSIIKRQYSVLDVSLAESFDVDLLCVVGPQKTFSDIEKKALDQYIMSGKPVIFMVDGGKIDFNTFDRSQQSHDLSELLSKYGIEVSDQLVGDFGSHERLTTNSSDGRLTEEYPLWPVLFGGQNSGHIITQNSRPLVFPWVSRVDMRNATGSILLRSSDKGYAFTREELPNVSPKNVFKPNESLLSSVPVAGIIEGALDSAYSSTDVQLTHTDNARIIAFGGTQIIQNQIVIKYPSNAFLVVSTIDYAINQDKLSAVRQKTITERNVYSGSNISNSKWMSLGIVSICVLFVAMLSFGLRALLTSIMKKKYVFK